LLIKIWKGTEYLTIKMFFYNLAGSMSLKHHDELEKLYKLHHKSLSNLAYNLLKDKDLARDVVQEVFLKLWQNRARIDFGDQISHYLTKATAHTALNQLRSSRKLTSLDAIELASLENPKGNEDYSFVELEIKIREAIERLPPKCKAIFLLSRHEGMKYNEIASTLNLSVKTVENQMGIALEKLRRDLKPFLSPIISVVLIILCGVILTIFKSLWG
jgi:RNA polymerase sigma-70 factor, ECF subfamily